MWTQPVRAMRARLPIHAAEFPAANFGKRVLTSKAHHEIALGIFALMKNPIMLSSRG